MNHTFIYILIVLSMLNLLRITAYLVSSDIYSLRQVRNKRRFITSKQRAHLPTMSILIPAHNEAATIERTVRSVLGSDYPRSKLQVIVIDDGSTDDTGKIVRRLIYEFKNDTKLRLVSQSNKGKAAALNNAMKRYATGRIVMCLDADSLVDPQNIRNAAAYFRNRKVVSVASNVNIIENKTILGLAQRIEYLVCSQMKKAHTTMNMEYIVGGVGSFYRRTIMDRVEYYDTNTMTEDIDLTMKVLTKGGNRNQLIMYGADCITYTQPVGTLRALINQRYRWKFGRLQTFLKHTDAFFSRDKKYAKQLTFFMLPFALVQELLFFLEPIVISILFYTCIRFHDTRTLLTAITVLAAYVSFNIWASEHLTLKQRLRYSYYAPAMYLLFYLLSIAEYSALIKSIFHLPRLKSSLTIKDTTWTSPDREVTANL